ncbi:autophagy-related protein 20 [Trichomonascus vanleenenianus]|uniref:Atg20p n=1 Tax=Trichomonascus vanleenenianus TaxID=2268995 RepID=UPI003EC96234
MADFEDNNPFAASGSERRFSNSSNDFSNLSISSPTSDRKPSVDRSSSRDDDSSSHHATKTYLSKVEQILVENPDYEITIPVAAKTHEGNSRGYIAYSIKLMDLTVRRRYSEFESLRTTLTRLFPTVIIPPIPEKHSMSDYAASPTKAKEDTTIIEHRQRMLAVFLNRCKDIKEVRENSVFQRFLDPNSSWSEVLNTPPVSDVPKNILKAPPINPSTASAAHSYLPVPSSSSRPKMAEDSAFDDAEANAKEYEAVIAGGLEKVNRRIIKRYSEMATDYSDLGAKFNAYSLEEEGKLASAIEKVGQAIDNSYLTYEALVTALTQSFSERLSESAQFAAVVRAVLKYRRQKALQQELTSDSLVGKRTILEQLERSEQEAQRINQYLQREGLNVPTNGNGDLNRPTSPTEAAPPPPPPKKKGGFKIPGIGKLNHAIHGFMDVDPEATRRSNIGKTREQIAQLEEALTVVKEDVVVANDSVKDNLLRFQEQKEDDMRRIMKVYVQCHLEWARKNLESWQEAKQEIEKV